MIYGIGTDLASISRMQVAYERHGRRLLERILTPTEAQECGHHPAPASFLAKRFAAKEALGKALGSGVRYPVTLRSVAIAHDALGRPHFEYAPALAEHLAARQLRVHLSLSDDGDFALAFVIAEQLM